MTIPPGIKVAYQISPEPSEAEFKFAQGLGVEYVTTWIDSKKASPEYYASRKQLFADNGLKLYSLGNPVVHNQDKIVLNLPGRDAKIEEYKQHLRNLAFAGIPYTTYAHMGNGIWSSAYETSRGQRARAYNQDAPEAVGSWNWDPYPVPLSHGKTFTQAEIWNNYEYCIRQVAPVAEQEGVLIGIHPDDPPVPMLGGVPRCIFSSFDGYERAMQIADSPNVGLCLCVGCWLEGGPLMGKGVLETIDHFGKQGKIFKVHFRNVDKPLPHFVETFLNNGYMDMRLVMEALHKVGFSGVAIPDHVPHIGDDNKIGTAYTIGYMQALLAGVVAASL
jgi:mannonate dehydratase